MHSFFCAIFKGKEIENSLGKMLLDTANIGTFA